MPFSWSEKCTSRIVLDESFDGEQEEISGNRPYFVLTEAQREVRRPAAKTQAHISLWSMSSELIMTSIAEVYPFLP